MESTFEKLDIRSNDEIVRLKRSIDCSSTEALKSSVREFRDITESYIFQYNAIIKTALKENRPAFARSINEGLIKELRLRAIAIFEVAAQINRIYPDAANRLHNFGLRIANIREYLKNTEPEQRELGHIDLAG
ncbi:hypothetical protein IKG73_00935 [Candidatus Saccharibacteria bacterium]|nr:hypothetical protein [Candidatus Saccharibacteria bacterium]